MQTADNVARWFLSRNNLKFLAEDTEFISNLKLQKLLYYAQGMNLALYGMPLFDEPIVAWAHGPVVESVYQTYKNNGSEGIKKFKSPTENFTAEEEDTLQFTQNAFGQFSAWKLREMTHNETPWLTTNRNEEIPRDKIKKYFEENYIE